MVLTLQIINEIEYRTLKMRTMFTDKIEIIYLLDRTFEFYIAESINTRSHGNPL